MEIRRRDWLHAFLSLCHERYQPLEPGPGESAVLLRLQESGVWQGLPCLEPAMREAVRDWKLDEGTLAHLALLKARFDIVTDARLLSPSGEPEPNKGETVGLRILEFATVDALLAGDLQGFSDGMSLSRTGAPKRDALCAYLRGREKAIVERERRRPGLPMASACVSAGLACVDGRTAVRIAAQLWDREESADVGLEGALLEAHLEKYAILQVLAAMAWADGKLLPEERDLLEFHIAYLDLPASYDPHDVLRAPVGLDEVVTSPIHPTSRRQVLGQVTLLAMVDDEVSPEEAALLEELALRLEIGPDERLATELCILDFYQRHRDLVRGAAVVGPLRRLQRRIFAQVHDILGTSVRRVVTEIAETRDLARLLAKSVKTPLEPEELRKVKDQLVDLTKTIPALGVFLLPGGGLILPVLAKLLPFNILPSAFADSSRPAQTSSSGRVPVRKGFFIVIEGIDGAGKSLQADLLAGFLEQRGHTVTRLREPTSGPWGRKIREAAERGLRPTAAEEASWFMADRRAHVEDVIRPALARGDTIVQDRYYPSTVAYQGARGLSPEDLLAQNREFAPAPDIVFLLDIPPDVGIARIEKGRARRDAFEELESLNRVRELFLSMSIENLVRVDGTLPPGEVQAYLRQEVERRLEPGRRAQEPEQGKSSAPPPGA